MTHLNHLARSVDLQGLSVVDIGAGDGSFAGSMSDRGAKVTGIEIDSEKVDRANSLHGKKAEFLVGTAETLPLEDNTVDLFTFIFSMHHVPLDLHVQATQELARCLRKGGRVHFVEPDVEGPMTEVVTHVEDETKVRSQTQIFLNLLSETGKFTLLEHYQYDIERTYADFGAVVKSIVMVDPARAARLPAVQEEMENTFHSVSVKTTEGYSLLQPCNLHHFEIV